MNNYEEFRMTDFETYSFTRLVRTQHLEFFFILGINAARNFNEFWDGRSSEVLGYLVTYSGSLKDEQLNYIYLIEDKTKDFQDIILHTKMFASEMHTYLDDFKTEEFIIKKTTVCQKGLLKKDILKFIKEIVNEDIPDIALKELM